MGLPPALPRQSTCFVGHVCWQLVSRLRTTGPVEEICPGLNANEIQISYDEHHKVSSLVKSHQNTRNSVRYEVI